MRISLPTGLVLIAVGAVLAFAVEPNPDVDRYVDLADLGLILVWTGVLVLAAYAWRARLGRPRRPSAPVEDRYYERDVPTAGAILPRERYERPATDRYDDRTRLLPSVDEPTQPAPRPEARSPFDRPR